MAVIDSNFGYEDTQKMYPYVLFKDYITELAMVLKDLPNGNLPLCIYMNGSEMFLNKYIPRELELLSKLADIQPYYIYVASGESYLIKGAEDLINLDNFSWGDS